MNRHNNIFIPEGAFTTIHEQCNILVNLLSSYGVRHVIVSPGSRNAPIVIALNYCTHIEKHIVVDERSAAFIAIGIAQQTNKPIAIVCTSGTAVLNYAPAIAEAYYQQLPIIVISADRVHEWIDQNDSQTLQQYGILNNIVKKSYDISSHNDDTSLWFANRVINEGLQSALTEPYGPIHFNIQLAEPLYERKIYTSTDKTNRIERVSNKVALYPDDIKEMVECIRSKKVLIVGSMQQKNQELTQYLSKISHDNIFVINEILANSIRRPQFGIGVDAILSSMSEESSDISSYIPDILITFGGAPVSRLLKTFLRRHKNIKHWRIGHDRNVIDTMQNLTKRIETSPLIFFSAISQYPIHFDNQFANNWENLCIKSLHSHNDYLIAAPWSDLKAMSIIMKNLPTTGLNLQISNGSAIRYTDLMGVPYDFEGTIYCNRGVSGIDGSTSTALGASIAKPDDTTLLITGDMSFSYDLSGLASLYNNKNFKIIVLCNGGGGIFRFISGPSELPEFEKYFEVHRELPINKYADAFGFDYLEADTEVTLQESLIKLLNAKYPSILSVYTDNKVSAQVLKEYYNRNK